jgi:hypothetical protein
MAALTCENCGSADIKQTTTGLFKNGYICNKCSRSFARLAGANIIMPTVPPALLALGTQIKNIVDSIDGSSKKSSRPTHPTRHPARQQPAVAPSPRHHQPPPVHGHSPHASPPQASAPVLAPGKAIGQERSNPSPGQHAGSPPRRPERP